MTRRIAGLWTTAIVGLSLGLGGALAHAESVLRIGMTAADVPTTTGMPNNGFEGMRFLGYPIFEAPIQWDLSKPDGFAGIKPALATEWKIDPHDNTKWTFVLRRGVKFHDGTDFNADAVLWNLARYYDDKAPQYDPVASSITRARAPVFKSAKKVDDYTVEMFTTQPASYFPFQAVYFLMSSPAQFAKMGNDWAKYAAAPAGTGPFRLTKFVPRETVELEKHPGYWDPTRIAKLDRIVLRPIPEATTRLAALRSGQVDWIEVPPPDAIPSLKAAGFQVMTNKYPHVWPYVFNVTGDSPFKDKRVRLAANYAVDRDGLVKLLNGTAEPAAGFLNPSDPNFGSPQNKLKYDPAKAKALLAEAGYSAAKPVKAKIMISSSGSGQMLPLPMNEFIQQTLKESWIELEFAVVEWNTMLVAFRQPPAAPQALGTHAINISLVSSDVSTFYRWFHSRSFAPTSSNWGHWKNDQLDAVLNKIEVTFDPGSLAGGMRAANEILVDDPPWLYIVHDLNPRVLSPKVKGFVQAQSWFQDLTPVRMD
ncbi:MAG: ABC transporter substrate-binding protein [Proteobacteria bacterium]|nr:ABC transporter substrate-binding protein [Pseudomonadota bacterium]